MHQTFEEDVALWSDLGIDQVGLISPKLEVSGWDVGRQAVADAGLTVTSMSCYKDGIATSIEFAASVGTDVLYVVTGAGGSARWEEAAEQFCHDLAPLVARGKEVGVRLAVEPTNPLRSDVSFLYSVRDAMDLARMADMGVVIDFYSAWYERGLDELVHKNIDLVALVQFCDYKLGTYDMPNRCALGDGDLPTERLFRLLVDAGYAGPFDLEILGPRIEEEGYAAPIVRSVERAGVILDRLLG
jgi:sugar phosphate isomerase/epimerase